MNNKTNNQVKVKRLHKDAIIPVKASPFESGFDLYTLVDTVIAAGETIVIPTGIAIQLNKYQEAQIRPRSGISLNGCKGCSTLFNNEGNISPYLRVELGTIDSSFIGDIGIIVYNQENYAVKVPAKTKLAQMVIQNIAEVDELLEVDSLVETVRGEKGFGSTGIN